MKNCCDCKYWESHKRGNWGVCQYQIRGRLKSFDDGCEQWDILIPREPEKVMELVEKFGDETSRLFKGVEINDLTYKLFDMIRNISAMRHATVCRHSVSLAILSTLLEVGTNVPDELIKAVAKNSEGDKEAIRIINKLLRKP